MFSALRDVLLRGAPTGRIADVLRHDFLYVHPDMLAPFFANHDVPRFASAEGSSPAKLKLAFGLTLTLRGVPEIYYGDEIGMPGGGDPDNRRDFPGGWIGDAIDAFTLSGRTHDQQEIFSYVQSLLRLRREHAALRTGVLWHLSSEEWSYVFAANQRKNVLSSPSTMPISRGSFAFRWRTRRRKKPLQSDFSSAKQRRSWREAKST